MNSKPSISFQEVGASIRAQLTAADAPRAVLVSLDRTGQLQQQPVGHGQSVLSISTELLDHLDHAPYSTAFLEELRDYCTARLDARAEAKRTGGVSMRQSSGFAITHVNVREVL